MVLPTRVGMVREQQVKEFEIDGSPHPRGDGPVPLFSGTIKSRFSPPAWGWSVRQESLPQQQLVLPTRVGMVRFPALIALAPRRSPHPRGDGPT